MYFKNPSFYLTYSAPTLWEPNKFCDFIADLCLDFFLQREPEAFCQVQVFIKNAQLQVNIHTNSSDAIQEQSKLILPYRIFEQFHIFSQAQFQTQEYGSFGLDLKVFHCTPNQIPLSQSDFFAFGFASYETDEYLPLGTVLAHKIAKAYQQQLETNNTSRALPGWAHIYLTVQYEHQVPKTLSHVRITLPNEGGQWDNSVILKDLHEKIISLICSLLPSHLQPPKEQIKIDYIPQPAIYALWGQSGRHAVSDHYGLLIPSNISLAGLSYKNPSKAAHYMSRLIARAIVQSGIATQCTALLSYQNAHTPPTLQLNFHNTQLGGFSSTALEVILNQNLDLSTEGIIKLLNLNSPLYYKTTLGGPFGSTTFPWESDALKDVCSLLESIENAFSLPNKDSINKIFY